VEEEVVVELDENELLVIRLAHRKAPRKENINHCILEL